MRERYLPGGGTKSVARPTSVILGLVPRICNRLILLTLVDPRRKAEDDGCGRIYRLSSSLWPCIKC
ncbi:hypothetical protein CFBP5473_10015 [Agrobacterium larrymoorei]|uniref:Uncharacterized protein n=1 Tax=Agrobacterium larrymoorei TaxID=160699 RepID=A0A4D7DVG7_9HYPH|nr:hypothetical protein CFBP5473_10015 [Agrobacterium larrymoorei]